MSALSDGDYLVAIKAAEGDPQQIEALYRGARGTTAEERFRVAMESVYQEAPGNPLFGAWHYRLAVAESGAESRTHTANWRVAIPISIVLGLAYWALSDPSMTASTSRIPLLALVWAPLAALAITWYLTLTARRGYGRAAIMTVALIAAPIYVLFAATSTTIGANADTYITLMALHVPLLASCAVGIAALGWRSSVDDRFALLTKAYEVIATAGIAAIAGGVFVGLTIGVFSAISVNISTVFARLLIVGGAGLIPTLAVAAVYDARLAPLAQDFRRGLARLLATLMRALLPLTVLTLAIYLAFIPFNFLQPFVNRDVLIVFNALLFAALALLVGVTPVHQGDLSPRLAHWLQVGATALAMLVTLISLYALAAILYRTFNAHELTMNRVAVIGWNIINIGILVALLIGQLKAGADWAERARSVFGIGAAVYLGWGLLLTLALPWALPLTWPA